MAKCLISHTLHPAVWVWESSIPQRLRWRLKRLSSHTEGSPHEIESHVAAFSQITESTRALTVTERTARGSEERSTGVSLFKAGRLVRAVALCCNEMQYNAMFTVCSLQAQMYWYSGNKYMMCLLLYLNSISLDSKWPNFQWCPNKNHAMSLIIWFFLLHQCPINDLKCCIYTLHYLVHDIPFCSWHENVNYLI